jgi:hypothetical protein
MASAWAARSTTAIKSGDDNRDSQIDWGRLCRRALLFGVAFSGVYTLYANISSGTYGFDFHGIWEAGRSILAGQNPYPAADWHKLLVAGNPYVLPPMLGILTIPFSALPFRAAVAMWNGVCTVSLIGALALVGVRDRRVYVVAALSFPFVASLALGQPDGVFLLAAAVAWRYRDSWPGALAVGFLIAAKLLAWPLLLWLLFRGRVRLAVLALVSAVGLLLTSWATIGFDGLTGYVKLLAADAHAFAIRSHSVAALVMRLGASSYLDTALTIVFAIAIALLVLRMAQDHDHGAFVASIVIGLLLSPILWTHYLVLLFVPLAIRRRRLDAVWLLLAGFWFSPKEPPATGLQVALVLVLAAVIAVAAGAARAGGRPAMGPAAAR